jgi:hypothetical protein
MPQRNWLITGVRRGGDWERERAAGFLHEEILSVLVVITQQFGVRKLN